MIDILVVVSLLVFSYVGYKRGLVRSVLTLLSSVLALGAAFIVQPIISSFLKGTGIYTWIYTNVANKIGEIDFGLGIQSQSNAIIENITWLPEILVEKIKLNNNFEMYSSLGANNITEYISICISNILIGLLSILIMWIIFKIAIAFLIGFISTVVEHLPIISTLNKYGGLGIGVIKGLFMISLIFLMLPIINEVSIFTGVVNLVNEGAISSWLYENNIIVGVFNAVTGI